MLLGGTTCFADMYFFEEEVAATASELGIRVLAGQTLMNRTAPDAVHEEGALILQQLYHVGQHGDSDNSYHANWSPSGMPSYHDY